MKKSPKIAENKNSSEAYDNNSDEENKSFKDSHHISNILTMANEKSPNDIKEFFCENCQYTCAKKSEWLRHTKRKKHLNLINTNKIQVTPHTCVCGKKYKHLSSLCKHRTICSSNLDTDNVQVAIQEEDTTTENASEAIIEFIKKSSEMQTYMMEQHRELQNTIIELSKKQELTLKAPSTVIQNQVNQFNLNFFLNEQCKNAINIQEFLDNIQLTVADIEATGRLGYVNGISRIFINKLKEMDVFTRPLHCTDLKRETVYIRDQNTWEKEKEEQPKLKKVVKIIARKNLKQLPAWQEKNPEYAINNSAQNEEFTKLSLTCLGAFTDEEEERDTQKILRNVFKGILVEKNIHQNIS
jgi:hypothetical protein|uniref:C2H2-type domain-containing protein n=1 Tax=viral metagenome TaxID=1070528 RepID=A0A6C0D4Q1_9ZZZZ